MYSMHRVKTQWLLRLGIVAVIGTGCFIAHALLVGIQSIDVNFEPAPFNQGKEYDYNAHYGTIFTAYKNRAHVAQEIKPEERNLFAPFVIQKQPKEPFAIKQIVFEPFVFMYMGFIERKTSEFVAQINWASKTYFVHTGDTIKEWTISKITKDEVVAVDASGESIELPLQKKVFSKKPFARVKIYRSAAERKITIGDTVEGYKVLDITRDTVILTSNSGVLTVDK